MKLTIKTLKQKIFTIDVWGEETVFEVKEKIQAVRNSHLENQKLFHAGQELANDRTVASYDIDEDEFLVLVVSKQKCPSAPLELHSSSGPGATALNFYSTSITDSEIPSSTSSPSLPSDLLMQPPILEDSHTDRIKSLVHQLRAAMDDDPYSIPSIFDKLVEADPQLPRRLSQIPGAAEQLFVGGGGYDWVINQDRSPNQRVQLVSLTSQERGTLDRLQALGVSHQQALEAFIVCDKNEMLAASYLFEGRSQSKKA